MRSHLAVRIILLVCAMVEKCSEKFCRLRVARSSAVRSTDPRLRKSSQDCFHARVIKLEIFFSRTFPVRDIGLIPHLPQPGLNLGIAITLAKMLDELENEFRPLPVILRRISPSREDVADDPRKVVTIRLRMSGKRLRHKPKFHQWLDASCTERIENPVQNYTTVDRPPGWIFRVDIR